MSERQLQVSILNDAVHIKKLNDELKVQHAAAVNARAITSTVGNKLAAVLKEMAKKQYSKDKASQVKYAQMQAQVVQATNDNTVLQRVHTQQLSTAAQLHADEFIALKAVAQQERDQLQAAANALTVASQMQAAEVARVNEAKAKAAANVTSIQTQTSATATATVGTSTSVSTANGDAGSDDSDDSDDLLNTVEVTGTGTADDRVKVKAVTKSKTKKVKKSATVNTDAAEPETTVEIAAAATTTDDSDSKATKKKTKKKSKTAVNTTIMDETIDESIDTADTTTDIDAIADVT
eukprot:18914-Heterococcus_DN1.PRE.1